MNKLSKFGLFLSCFLCLQGCSIKQVATSKLGDTLAARGSVYASDDDIELVGGALVFYGAPIKLVNFAGMGLLIAGMYLMRG